MKILQDSSLTYDDVWIYPQYSKIKSRADCNTSSLITTNIKAQPILSADMPTVTGAEMMKSLSNLGGIPVLHRELTIEKGMTILRDNKPAFMAASIGVKGDYIRRLESYVRAGCKLIVIGIAHADSDNMNEALDNICNLRMLTLDNRFDIMVGSIASPQAMLQLVQRFGGEIDGVRVGIGPGHACKTRKVTGVGVGQFTAVKEVSEIARQFHIPVCADGGIHTAGDVAKAIGAGANSVMSGFLLAHALESPGWVDVNPTYKIYEGSAYFDYKDPSAPDYKVSEGREMMIQQSKPLKEIVDYLLGGLRSAMSYSNASTIKEFQENVIFQKGNLRSG